ncbi:hypothetical protein [Sphingomonas panacis]|nr:hypothetical protein [Sphingomonas panacis]
MIGARFRNTVAIRAGAEGRPMLAGSGPPSRSRRSASAFALLILPALAACAATSAIEGPVRLGQIAYVNGPRVRVDRVTEDSRCPVGTQCVWAGRLMVRATVLGGRWSRQVDLTLGVPVDFADGKLTLVKASPDRRTAKPPPYRFTFSFQGGL